MNIEASRSLNETDIRQRMVIRHPEKKDRPVNIKPPLPAWIRAKAPQGEIYEQTKAIVREQRLHTVCEEAGCPNIGECWNKRHATFMIMGGICTRACAFCNVATGIPMPLDPDEPRRVAESIAKLGLKHAVITSVDRDDLSDGGVEHFVATIAAIRKFSPHTTIEVLTPDFLRKPGAAQVLAQSEIDVFNHNLETVPALYTTIRPGARYFTSLRLLQEIKERNPKFFTKSGIMLGLGETHEQVIQVMDDLRSANVDFLTIGQYLSPSPQHAKIQTYATPEYFNSLKTLGLAKGFLLVASSPLTRSSYHADEDFLALRDARIHSLHALAI